MAKKQPTPDPAVVRALAHALGRDDLRVLLHAAEAHAATLDHIDRAHPSPELRADSARLQQLAANLRPAIHALDYLKD